MALNIEMCSKLTKNAASASGLLSRTEYEDLFEKGFLSKFDDEQKKFQAAFKEAQDEGRKLRIGVIGSVKAGKSSFLNALFFEGEDRLPKAATPMTAALTVISYAETPKAVIHFYSQEDWNGILQKSAEYDAELNKRYFEYEKKYNEALNESSRIKGFVNSGKKISPLYPKTDYEVRIFRREIDDALISSKELVRMASNTDKLGTTETVKPEELDQYIGAGGKYTAIVSYVELCINDKSLDGFEIIDTPGLNDPIVSRGKKTMEYLSHCDAAILLSSTTQFMDASTMELMLNTLPSSGVREIILVGSKLDSGMLDYKESGIDVTQVYKSSVNTYRKHIANNINEIRLSRPDDAEKLEQSQTAFVSAMLYSMHIKRRNGISFNEEEQHIYRMIASRFTNFDDSLLLSLSGVNDIMKKLNAVLERKADIINEKNDKLCKTYSDNFYRILCDIRSDANQAKKRLETMTVEELRNRQGAISELLESSRNQISSVCHIEALEVAGRVDKLKAQIKQEIGCVEMPKINNRTEHRIFSYRSGVFGVVKNHESYDEVINYVEVSDAVQKIKKYTGRLESEVLNNFRNIINKDALIKKIKGIITLAMHDHGGSYSENDVLLPLNETIVRLSVPEVCISENEYIDRINAEYKKGKVEGEQIHKFNNRFISVLNSIAADISNDIDKHTEIVTNELGKNADKFIDQMNTKMSSEIKRLENQIAEKEENIQKYRNFLDALNEIIPIFNQ